MEEIVSTICACVFCIVGILAFIAFLFWDSGKSRLLREREIKASELRAEALSIIAKKFNNEG